MRVMVAEDEPFLRNTIASGLIDRGVSVVGTAANTEELLRLVDEKAPTGVDVALLDMGMPQGPAGPSDMFNGLEAAREIRRRYPEIAIMVFSNYANISLVLAVANLGSRIGYQLKTRAENLPEIIESMQALTRGESRIDPSIIDDLVNRPRPDNLDPIRALSERDRAVLALGAQGLSNGSIASQLSMPLSTVEASWTAIYRSCAIPNDGTLNQRVTAVIHFLRSGWMQS